MSVKRTEGLLLAPINTRAFVTDPSGLQVLSSAVTHWTLRVYLNDRDEVLYDTAGLPGEVMFDVPRPWGDDAVGYNFEHELRYDEEFRWAPNQILRLEYVIHVTVGANTVLVPFIRIHKIAGMRTREIDPAP